MPSLNVHLVLDLRLGGWGENLAGVFRVQILGNDASWGIVHLLRGRDRRNLARRAGDEDISLDRCGQDAEQCVIDVLS